MNTSPTPASATPVVMVAREPTRPASLAARPEASIIEIAMGIRAAVDSSPDHPSTAWKNGNSTTPMPAWTPKTTSSVSEPLARPRSRNRRTSSREAARRRSSHPTKPMPATMPTARLINVSGAVQPRSGPSCSTKMRPTTATVESSAPTVSKG